MKRIIVDIITTIVDFLIVVSLLALSIWKFLDKEILLGILSLVVFITYGLYFYYFHKRNLKNAK